MELDKCDKDVGIVSGMAYMRKVERSREYSSMMYEINHSFDWLLTDDDLTERLPRTSHMREKIMEARRWS